MKHKHQWIEVPQDTALEADIGDGNPEEQKGRNEKSQHLEPPVIGDAKTAHHTEPLPVDLA